LPADYSGQFYTCYAHIGQHSSCSREWYQSTRPATESESESLLRELRGIYESGEDPVKLEIYKRMTPAHRRAFNNEAARYRKAVSGESAWVQGRITESPQGYCQ